MMIAFDAQTQRERESLSLSNNLFLVQSCDKGKTLVSTVVQHPRLLLQIDPYILSQNIEKATAFNALKVKARVIHGWVTFLADFARPKNSQRCLAESFMVQLQKKNAIKAWRVSLERNRKEIWQYVRAEQHLEFQVFKPKPTHRLYYYDDHSGDLVIKTSIFSFPLEIYMYI